MARVLVFVLAAAACARADERTQRLVSRLAEEAAAFQRVAPRVIGTETLEQRALQPAPRLRLRIGKAATQPRPPQLRRRVIVSEYAFSALGAGASLHELRQVTSVDGKVVRNNKGSEALAKTILAGDEGRKRELLKQFSQYGLSGAVTDFGPLLLLFAPASIDRYEFSFLREAHIGETAALAFSYKQIDGPNSLTVIDALNDRTQDLPAHGEIWVRQDTYTPLKISMHSGSGDVLQDAAVEYAASSYGSVLPARIDHVERRAGTVTVENHFTYSGYRRFGASADIIFEPEDPK